MVKVAQMNFPPGYEALVGKILAWFDNQHYGTWATRNKQDTRSAKARNKKKTIIPSASAAWKALTDPDRVAWGAAAAFGTLSKYQLFLSDYAYRRSANLSLPGTPHMLYEVMGLKLSNPTGIGAVRVRLDQKDLFGPVDFYFSYKKTEYDPPIDQDLHAIITLYTFRDGANHILTYDWTAPSGSVNWTQVHLVLGDTETKYFHMTVEWYLDDYNADVFIDHVLVSDVAGDVYREEWRFKKGKEWSYDNLYRKRGWLFYPDYALPYFDVVYLDL